MSAPPFLAVGPRPDGDEGVGDTRLRGHEGHEDEQRDHVRSDGEELESQAPENERAQEDADQRVVPLILGELLGSPERHADEGEDADEGEELGGTSEDVPHSLAESRAVEDGVSLVAALDAEPQRAHREQGVEDDVRDEHRPEQPSALECERELDVGGVGVGGTGGGGRGHDGLLGLPWG